MSDSERGQGPRTAAFLAGGGLGPCDGAGWRGFLAALFRPVRTPRLSWRERLAEAYRLYGRDR